MAEPSAPTAVTYAAAGGTTVVASLSANEVGVYGGLLIAACTFLMNWHYKRLERKDRLDAQREEARRKSGD